MNFFLGCVLWFALWVVSVAMILGFFAFNDRDGDDDDE